jgi:hypothetical protein
MNTKKMKPLVAVLFKKEKIWTANIYIGHMAYKTTNESSPNCSIDVFEGQPETDLIKEINKKAKNSKMYVSEMLIIYPAQKGKNK